MCILQISQAVTGEICFVNANPKDKWSNNDIEDLFSQAKDAGFTNMLIACYNGYDNCLVFTHSKEI